jgi:maleylpyruvate isomerase
VIHDPEPGRTLWRVRPAANIELLRSGTRRLLRTVDGLTDDQAHEASRLPGWNRAEVLTHLARNADGTRRMVHAAAHGEVEAQYPGGLEERAADIAAGRDARADDVVRDVRRAHDAMMEAWQALPDDAWPRVGRVISGERTMREALWARVREVEVHHLDLAMGYEPTDWPVGFVSGALDDIFATFELRESNVRPLVDADFRVVSTDHDRAWRVMLHGTHVDVEQDAGKAADGEARGWGCDLVAWLYGRDPHGGGITASGETAVLRLPAWFPYA